jgi:hypothetical protein
LKGAAFGMVFKISLVVDSLLVFIRDKTRRRKARGSRSLREVLEKGLEVLQGNRGFRAFLAEHPDAIAFEDEKAVAGGKRRDRWIFSHGDGTRARRRAGP